MSVATLRMPRLGETMEQGEIASWTVPVGSAFKRGDALVELETDKTVVELPALGAGTLLETLAEPGDVVAVGEPIARIDIGDGPDWCAGDTEGAATEEPDTASAAPVVESSSSVAPTSDNGDGPQLQRATPAARHLAREQGIALSDVRGSGRLGRIEAWDLPARDAPTVLGVDAPAAIPGAELFDVAGLRVAVAGPADGAPVLLLHGLAGGYSTWAGVATMLAKGGCRVVAVDLPGHGASTLPASGVEALGEPLPALLSALDLQAPVHVVAHSLGAAAALTLAEQRPAASLSLLAPAGLGLTIDAAFVRGVANPGTVDELSHLLARLSSRAPALSRPMLQALHADLQRGRLQALAESLLGRHGQAIDLTPAIERCARTLTVRVLIGHRDRIVRWQDALRLPPSVAVHHFSDAGHMPHWDEPREVGNLLMAAILRTTR